MCAVYYFVEMCCTDSTVNMFVHVRYTLIVCKCAVCVALEPWPYCTVTMTTFSGSQSSSPSEEAQPWSSVCVLKVEFVHCNAMLFQCTREHSMQEICNELRSLGGGKEVDNFLLYNFILCLYNMFVWRCMPPIQCNYMFSFSQVERVPTSRSTTLAILLCLKIFYDWNKANRLGSLEERRDYFCIGLGAIK